VRSRGPLVIAATALAIELACVLGAILVPGIGGECRGAFSEWLCTAVMVDLSAPPSVLLSVGPPVALVLSLIAWRGRSRSEPSESILPLIGFALGVTMTTVDVVVWGYWLVVSHGAGH
jgi:hypothetical protein